MSLPIDYAIRNLALTHASCAEPGRQHAGGHPRAAAGAFVRGMDKSLTVHACALECHPFRRRQRRKCRTERNQPQRPRSGAGRRGGYASGWGRRMFHLKCTCRRSSGLTQRTRTFRRFWFAELHRRRGSCTVRRSSKACAPRPAGMKLSWANWQVIGSAFHRCGLRLASGSILTNATGRSSDASKHPARRWNRKSGLP